VNETRHSSRSEPPSFSETRTSISLKVSCGLELSRFVSARGRLETGGEIEEQRLYGPHVTQHLFVGLGQQFVGEQTVRLGVERSATWSVVSQTHASASFKNCSSTVRLANSAWWRSRSGVRASRPDVLIETRIDRTRQRDVPLVSGRVRRLRHSQRTSNNGTPVVVHTHFNPAVATTREDLAAALSVLFDRALESETCNLTQ